MGYAPNAVIISAPSPALTGGTLQVGSAGIGSAWNAGMGDAFPEPPFTALVWPNQQFPVVGVNAETPLVTKIVNDTFYLTRGALPIAIQAGLRIAALTTVDMYDLGDVVSLVGVADHDAGGPYTLHLRDPQGYSYTEARPGSATWAGTVGAGALTRSGIYHYAFGDVNGERSPEQDFFVRFSEVGR